MGRKTVKELLQEMGYSPEKIEALILAGGILDGDTVVRSRGHRVKDEATLRVRTQRTAINRAQGKLEGALHDFGLDVAGKTCVDLGASHGGFTQCLLEHGAHRVYAVDVAYGIFDYRLRTDDRVVLLERTNVRQINESWFREEDLQSPVFLVADLSFISIRTVMKSIDRFFYRIQIPYQALVLIKPQFEQSHRTENGVVQDPEVRQEILQATLDFFQSMALEVIDTTRSRVPGADGNLEYFALLEKRTV